MDKIYQLLFLKQKSRQISRLDYFFFFQKKNQQVETFCFSNVTLLGVVALSRPKSHFHVTPSLVFPLMSSSCCRQQSIKVSKYLFLGALSMEPVFLQTRCIYIWQNKKLQRRLWTPKNLYLIQSLSWNLSSIHVKLKSKC